MSRAIMLAVILTIQALDGRSQTPNRPQHATIQEEVQALMPTPGASAEERANAVNTIISMLTRRLEASRAVAEIEAISEQAEHYSPDLAVTAARKAVRISPQRAAANMRLAMALWQRAQAEIAAERNSYLQAKREGNTTSSTDDWFDNPVRKRRTVFLEAEKYALIAIANTKQPTWSDYSNIATIQDDITGREAESYINNRHALAVAQRDNDEVETTITLQQLWPQALNLHHREQGKQYFAKLMKIQPDSTQRILYAMRMDGDHDYLEAAAAYFTLAELSSPDQQAGYYASAAQDFIIGGNEERSLDAARRAIAAAPPQDIKNSAIGNRIVSEILLDRGVYEQALRHAQEAVAAVPDDYNNQISLAHALNALHRNQEALTAAQTALRLSDGKYGFVHFTIGAIYFDMSDWRDAEEAFRHAANLNKNDSAASFNVALCLQNQGFKSDAADWFEETLRRNPKHPKRADLEVRIKKLRAVH